MKKFYAVANLVLTAFMLLGSVKTFAQITVTTTVPSNLLYNSATADGAIVFGVKNTTAASIQITDVANYVQAGLTATLTLWYHPTAVTGAPTAINTTNGWVSAGTASVTNNPTAGITPLFTGLNITIPANTTYRFAISGPPFSPYYAPALTTPNFYTGSGLEIYTQDNTNSPGYGGAFPGPPANTPRGFIGSVTFSPTATCTSPPTPGNARASRVRICSGQNFTLDLVGNSIGTGQTYQWQSSPNNSTWTNVGSSSNTPVFTTTQTAATYYRVGVTCGGNTQYSTSVLVEYGPLSGTYTINSAVVTGGTNFQSFTDAIQHLVCVSGPVVFNVVSGSGPYTEQIALTPVTGASAVNTITFNGNNETLRFNPVSGLRHIIALDGADYITIKKLNIVSQNSTFGWGVHLADGANNNTIDSCTIDVSLVTSTTVDNSAGIVVANSVTDLNADGSASNNMISNNTIIGGYQGVIMNGGTGAVNVVNNTITKNTIRDFYSIGMELTENDGTIVSYNDIHRTNRVAVTTFEGIELGAGNKNVLVNANRIHDTHTSASTLTGTSYGIFSSANDAPVGSENKITNNLIYNFNGSTGIQYGLYNSGSDGVRYYHNTVVLNNAASTAGTTKTFYQTTAATNIELKNNILYLTRGGTGTKHLIDLNTTTSAVVSNNNVLYLNSPAGTNSVGAFGATNYATLAAWQTANSGAYDQLSVSVDPQFASPATGNFYPNNGSIFNVGANVGVTADILNLPRNVSAPTPGAYEITASGCVSPPTPGTATASFSSTPVCLNAPINLNLTGNSTGAGQTYQWQISPTQAGTYSNIGSSQQNAPFTYNPTVTAWYRAAVTCSGNTQYSVPVQVVVVQPLPGGVYTINSAVATGGTNFQTFTDAVIALGCGITGPIVFNVAAGSGPYNERISIPQVNGMSATNTVTFNGNGAIMQASSANGHKYLIQLDGADYVRIKKLNLLTQGTTGWGVHLLNGANYNLVDSCTIDLSSVTSVSIDSSAAIVVANSLVDLNATGNANYNVFSNNTMIGGYQGIIINGAATALDAVNNVISNNTIRDFYANGIELVDTDSTRISFNDIHRANRTGVTGFEGVELGAGNRNALINGNRIHDTHNSATTQTGLAYGIYITGSDAPVGSENKVINNLIYNFNSASGTQYGLYNVGSNGAWYYHNTVVLNNAASTAGTTKGFYQTTAATNIEFKNNIVFITRGGTGAKHTIDLGTTTSAVISNNNVLYINSAAGTNFIGAFGTTDYATLATWQTANSNAYDQQSVSVDPQFASPATANFYPNNTTIATLGANVGVTTDILGNSRSTTPTPGAYEIIITTSSDMGALDLFAPVQKVCYSNAETVTVRIKNYSAAAHNFATSPVTVNVNVTGPNPTTFAPVVVNTGTLPPGDTLVVVISTTYNMSAPGTYVFNGSTTVAGDVNATNNAMPSKSLVAAPLAAGTVSANPSSYCVTGGTPTLTLNGGGGGSIQWQESPTGIAGSWVNVGTNNTSYTPATAITATRYYRAYRTCNATGDTSATVTVTLSNPQLLGTTPGVRCGPGTVALSATGSAGATFNWYTSATGGVPVGTGSPFTTPFLLGNTTYYVAASTGGTSNINLGLPAEQNGTSGAGLANFGLVFDALVPFTLNTVTIYPVSATAGTAGTVTIDVIDGNNNVLHTATVNVIGNPTAAPVAQTVTLNFNIQPGTNLKLRPGARSASITGLLFEPSASAPPSGNYGYPFVVPGVVSINTSTLTVAPTNTARNDLYYYFYNWSISTGCESPRQAVNVTINPAPSLDVTNDLTVCNNAITPLAVTTPLANFNTYTWSPATGLYTDAAATTAYVAGANASSLFARIATPGTYTFYATSNNTTTNCQNIDSVKVTVLPASITVVPSPDKLCVGGTSSLSILPNPANFGAAQYQWQSSPNNTTYTNIASATGPTYTTPTISATTYYKVDLKNSAGVSCTTAYDTVLVNAPAILSTTPAALCAPGVMTLAATATPGATIHWYTSATGGALVGTGATFTTPNLTTTTTYYAAAFTGGGSVDVGIKVNEFAICGAPVTSATTDQSLRFTTTRPIIINSAYIIPTAANVTVALRAQGSTVNIVTLSFSFTAAQIGTPQQISLGLSVGTPGNYQLVNTTGGIWRTTTLGCGYPFTSPGGSMSITGSATSSTGAANTTTYTGFYQINITEGCESAGVPVVAMVSSNTAITQQPVNISTCTGASINLVVGASGANLSYQWRKNGVNIANSNNDTLTISPVSVLDGGTYDVIITGLCGPAVTSTVASVNVAAGNTWLGTVSSDWNTAANWCGGIPTPTSDVTIFPGTPFQPVVNATIADVRTLTISLGAVVTLMPNATMNFYGDFVNNGTFSGANAFVFFKGAVNQNIGGMTVGNATVNGSGITLTGTMTVNQSMTLAGGNVTLGIHNLTVSGSVTGTLNSHVVTNSTGSVITKNVTATPVTVPVGPSSNSYNPVIISNGGGRDYSVRVQTGLNPNIANPGRAVNRTWTVTPNTPPAGPATITFQYEDAHMNAQGVATNAMEVGVHNGANWVIVTPNVSPSGSPTSRQVVSTTSQFGPMAVANIGGIGWITAVTSVDPGLSSVTLLPNLVERSALLKVVSNRSTKVRWHVTDMQGKVVMSFDRSVLQGQNDILLQLGHLAAGMYTLSGTTDKGISSVVKFIKQ